MIITDQPYRVLITGGTGTLGHAIVRRATAENWPWEITIFSRDFMKQSAMRREYPSLRYVMGDVRDYDSVYQTAVGHSIIIHAAAQKHIPAGEEFPGETFRTNVIGSENVITASAMAGVERAVFISTDKACYPVNVYGATKMIMETAVRLAADIHPGVRFSLCRYGNVLGSNGSVIEVWRKQMVNDLPITITDPSMTRFWLSEDQAVDLVLLALEQESGATVVPRAPACSMEDLARFVVGDERYESSVSVIGRRPGEKQHECLLTMEEGSCVYNFLRHWSLVKSKPMGEGPTGGYYGGYFSDAPMAWLTAEDLAAMVR